MGQGPQFTFLATPLQCITLNMDVSQEYVRHNDTFIHWAPWCLSSHQAQSEIQKSIHFNNVHCRSCQAYHSRLMHANSNTNSTPVLLIYQPLTCSTDWKFHQDFYYQLVPIKDNIHKCNPSVADQTQIFTVQDLSLIHIWRCRRIERCRSRWSPYH